MKKPIGHLTVLAQVEGAFPLALAVKSLEVDANLANNSATTTIQASRVVVPPVSPVVLRPVPVNGAWFLLWLSSLMVLSAALWRRRS